MRQQDWKTIYDQYAPQMLCVCRRYCTSKDTARDLMHDGFMQVFKSLDHFTDRGPGSLGAWITRIMINTCLQNLRKKDLLRESAAIETLPMSFAAADEEGLEKMVERVPMPVIQGFLDELPAGYRTVFNLYVFEEYSHKEIAQALGIKEKSSSSQFFRAKSILANKIRAYEKKMNKDC